MKNMWYEAKILENDGWKLHPVVVFLETEKGQAAHNQLKQLLGKVCEAEERLANRQYIPRILKEEEWG